MNPTNSIPSGIGRGRIPAILLMLAAASQAFAQYLTGFEPPDFTGSPAGVALAGQDGYYIPSIDDADAYCFTYAGNALGIVANPNGESQFIASTRISGAFARAQRDVAMSAECWVFEADINIAYGGTLPTANYAGSLSLQPWGQAGSIIFLLNWDDIHAADHYTIRVLGYDAEGDVPFLAGLPVPDSAFRGLLANHWYRLSIRIDFAQLNAVTSLSIRDLHDAAAAESTFLPTDLEGYYLGGGSAPVGVPSAFRFFAGGGFVGDHVAGNTLAIDNLSLRPASDTPCFTDIDPNNIIDVQDLANLLANFAEPGPMGYFDGDFDCDQDVDLADLAIMLDRFGAVCSIRSSEDGQSLIRRN